jgi:hypothetical protein
MILCNVDYFLDPEQPTAVYDFENAVDDIIRNMNFLENLLSPEEYLNRLNADQQKKFAEAYAELLKLELPKQFKDDGKPYSEKEQQSSTELFELRTQALKEQYFMPSYYRSAYLDHVRKYGRVPKKVYDDNRNRIPPPAAKKQKTV